MPLGKVFWSNKPKSVESEATAVEPAPQTVCARAANVALAISIARAGHTLKIIPVAVGDSILTGTPISVAVTRGSGTLLVRWVVAVATSVGRGSLDHPTSADPFAQTATCWRVG